MYIECIVQPLNLLLTARLRLRAISEQDAGLIFKMYNEPKFIEFIGDKNIRSEDEARAYIVSRFLPQYERLGYGNYVIERQSDGQKMGAIGIFEREGLDVHDIGFSLMPEYENLGYAFEAGEALLSAAASELGLSKVSAITTHHNYSSQKLISKLGLKFVKTVFLPGDDEELRYYERSLS